jgi:hypothetical protein
MADRYHGSRLEARAKEILRLAPLLTDYEVIALGIVTRLRAAYHRLVRDGVKKYIDIQIRMEWLRPLWTNPAAMEEVPVYPLTHEQRYRLRLRPLFALPFEEATNITEEDMVTFLLISERIGLI